MRETIGIVVILGFVGFLFFVAFSIGDHRARYKAHAAFCQRETGGECSKLNDKLWLSDKDGKPTYWVAP